MEIGVVIPCFKVSNHILEVLAAVPTFVTHIYVVDDACPEQSGRAVLAHGPDARTTVIFHSENQGVGGAVKTGYMKALEDGCEVVVKLDGDGQMDPSRMIELLYPIVQGVADYTKGNRFFDPELLASMPKVRVLGNAALSFITKFSSGYWNVTDPTNGYTAIHSRVLSIMPMQKVENRYFFESDMLFRLNISRAVVLDIPLASNYANEVSNLKIRKVLFEFPIKHLRNLSKRFIYNYYLRDMSVASFELPIGISLATFGLSFGAVNWFHALQSEVPTPTGTIMLAVLPIIVGTQFLLAFLSYDVWSVPKSPIHIRNRPPHDFEAPSLLLEHE